MSFQIEIYRGMSIFTNKSDDDIVIEWIPPKPRRKRVEKIFIAAQKFLIIEEMIDLENFSIRFKKTNTSQNCHLEKTEEG